MVPKSEVSYLPPLDKCLNGEQLILSWKTAFSAITSRDQVANDKESAIQQFIRHPDVADRLSHPFDTFLEPSAETKATFEQLTSAINVTTSSSSPYDIKEIKEDTLWLSQFAKIDEVSALRVAIVECQSRTSAQLLGPFSEEELISIREAAGNSKLSSSIPVSLLSQGADPRAIQKDFDSQDSRQQRILHIHLSERRYFLKCVEILLYSAFSSGPQDSRKGKEVEVAASSLESMSSQLVSRLGPHDQFITRCCKAIGVNVKNMETGSGWFEADGGREDIELEWIQSQIIEATHTMEMIFHFIEFSPNCSSSQVVLEWLRLLGGCGFFNNFEMVEPSITALLLPFQSLTTIISLSIFSLDACMMFLSDPEADAPVSANQPADAAYILNTETISQIHAMLLNAAEVGFTTAGPAMLAWSTLLQTMRLRVNESKASQMEANSANPFDHQSPVERDAALAPVVYEDILEQIMDSLDEDPIDFLARTAVNNCRAFETISGLALRLGNKPDSLFPYTVGAKMRGVILDLIRHTTGIGYIPEVVEATISALTGGQDYWDIVDSRPLGNRNDPIMRFWVDQDAVSTLLGNAASRYPYEPLPFLRMIRALALSSNCSGDDDSPPAYSFLKVLPTFTYELPEDFIDYQTAQEEDNNNTIRLMRPIQLFLPRSKSLRYQAPQGEYLALAAIDADFCIAPGTLGRIVSDSGPKVAFWFHQYPALKYFGKLLETYLTASDQVDGTTGMPVDRESVSEIIGILANLLLSISRTDNINDNSKENAKCILEMASSGLGRNQDIMSVVFDIFEEELQKQSAVSGSDVPLGILVSCVHFIHGLVPVHPGRVWPLLAQSGLLAVGRGGARLQTIVESVELISGRYDLLLSCCRLYESLVEDFATNAIRRRDGGKSSARFVDGQEVGTGVPEQVLSKTLLVFARYLVDTLESSCNWKFATQDDRRRLGQTIGTTFDKILCYAYGLESTSEVTPVKNSASKTTITKRAASKSTATTIMQALVPAASHIAESFLSTSSGNFRFQSLFHSYYDGLETPDFTTFLDLLDLWTGHVNSILCFSKTLLRVSVLQERPTSQLESHLFKSAPLIARLYAVNDAYRNTVVALFEALILAASSNTSEPPSLLGHLGPQTAKNFLHMLSDLDNPLSRESNVVGIWNFLSVVMSGRQQWFANYLLSGKTPRDALKTRTTGGRDLAMLDRSLLTTALEKLSNMDNTSQPEALAMLEFVALAQNFWPWTVYNSKEHVVFIQSISEFVGTLKPIQPGARLEAALDACYQTRVAAYVAEILAMHRFHLRQTGTVSQIKALIPNLSYFARFAVAVPTYNQSLHGQLKHNFESRYTGCTLRDLKRTTLVDRQYGKYYFYNLPLADKMLCPDEAWTGRKGRDDGLRNEFANANVNLSLVDSQIALFQSWKFLAIELSSNITAETDLQRMLAKVASDCMIANTRSQLPEDIFTQLSQTRADCALILIQRLVEAKSNIPEMKGLLSTVWETIRALRGSFDRTLPGGDTAYYRSLLKILFLALRVHADSNTPPAAENFRASLRMNQSSTIIPILLDIIKCVIAIGLRELASLIHDSPENSTPEDIALLTGILQSTLRVPGIELCHSSIVSTFVTHSTARIATTLFSWSDSLASSGDPIYGELSMLFLLELSSIPPMAEQMAIDGLLGHISSANITTYLHRGNVSPFADSAGLQRCYSIWVRGILPLLLNLLDAVQVNITAEVALFLNQFPSLLSQASEALEAPETNRMLAKGASKYITLSIASEIHSLTLIMYILNGFRVAQQGMVEIVDVEWDATGIVESVDFWLGSRKLLRERILPMGEREQELFRSKSGDVSVLEERIMQELTGVRDVLSGGD